MIEWMNCLLKSKSMAKSQNIEKKANNKSYWRQRYTLFSRYDEGIQMTNDSWFGVTAEPIAM